MKSIWIIVKPESFVLKKIDAISKLLGEQGFHVHKRIVINDWSSTSIELYYHSDKITQEQLELQNIGRKQLLGEASNYAEIWCLKYDYDYQNANTELQKIKRSFRNTNWLDGLNFSFEYKNQKTLYHYTYFHVPDDFDESQFITNDLIKDI